MGIKLYSGQGIACWSGNDEESHKNRHDDGAVGVISVTSNIVPGLMYKLMHGSRDDELDSKLQPLYKWLFTEPNPIGVNTLLMQLGIAEPVFRLPYTHTSKEMREQVLPILEKIGLKNFPVGPNG